MTSSISGILFLLDDSQKEFYAYYSIRCSIAEPARAQNSLFHFSSVLVLILKGLVIAESLKLGRGIPLGVE